MQYSAAMAFGRRGAVATEEADSTPAGSAGAIVYLLGGGNIAVRQGPVAVAKLMESSHAESCAVLADPKGRKIFVNPRAVTYVGRSSSPPPDVDAAEGARGPSARVLFSDGTTLEVVQGAGVVNQRLGEARAASAFFAPCATVGAQPAFVNHATVAAVTPVAEG